MLINTQLAHASFQLGFLILLIIYNHFLDLSVYLEAPLLDFCETLHNGGQAPKVCAA